MTTNQTIDGVPGLRSLIDRVTSQDLGMSAKKDRAEAAHELRALLDAPMPENDDIESERGEALSIYDDAMEACAEVERDGVPGDVIREMNDELVTLRAAKPQCDTVPVSAHWSDWSMVTLEIEGQHRTYVEYGKSQGDPVAIVVEQTHNYGNFLVFGSSIPGVQRPAPVVERKAHLLDQSLPTGTKLYAEQPAPVATIALIVGAIHDIPGFPGITGIQIRQLAERLNAKSR